MQFIAHLGHYFCDIHLSWVGPVYPILRLVHPDVIAPLLQASGIWSTALFPDSPHPSHTYTDQAEQGMKPCVICQKFSGCHQCLGSPIVLRSVWAVRRKLSLIKERKSIVWGVSSEMEHLPAMYKTLGCVHSTGNNVKGSIVIEVREAQVERTLTS